MDFSLILSIAFTSKSSAEECVLTKNINTYVKYLRDVLRLDLFYNLALRSHETNFK